MSLSGETKLQNLFEQKKISLRGYNICMRSRLYNVQLLVQYLYDHGDFLKLKGCGVTVESELLKIISDFNSKSISRVQETIVQETIEVPVTFSQSLKTLSPFKRATLNHQISYLIFNLSVRTLNGMKSQFGNSPSKSLIENIIDSDFEFTKIRNIGEKSFGELKLLREKVIQFLDVIRDLPEQDLSKEYSKLIIKNTFPELTAEQEDKLDRTFGKKGKTSIFKLLDILIDAGLIFNPTEVRIFRIVYETAKPSRKDFADIAHDFELTLERVRQIRIAMEKSMNDHFKFILNLNLDQIELYDLDSTLSLIVLTNDKLAHLNLLEGVNFNLRFYCLIIEILFSKSYNLLGRISEDGKKANLEVFEGFHNGYLINTILFKVFRFDKFVIDFASKINERITESYSLHFEGYLVYFYEKGGNKFKPEISQICEKILMLEFDIVVDTDGFVLIERNTKKPFFEFIKNVLEESGHLMTLEEIEIAMRNKFPELDVNEGALRSSMIRENELFMSIGRASTYGLRVWETKHENMRGGTIRDIVEELLEKEGRPLHLYDIMKWVNKYRATNEKNVLSNLRLENHSRFTFYPGGYVGLGRDKKSFENYSFKRLVGARFTIDYLGKFTGWSLDMIAEHYMKKYGYSSAQVFYALENKIAEGKLILKDNKLFIA